MLLQHYGLPVIAALNRFGSDTEREFEMIRKRLGKGVEALVCEHFANGSKGATNLAKSMLKLIDEKPGSSATTDGRRDVDSEAGSGSESVGAPRGEVKQIARELGISKNTVKR